MTPELSKSLAGYHLLMILSAVNGRFNEMEDAVILEYLKEEKLINTNLDAHTQYLNKLPADDYLLHFNTAMNSFYQLSDSDDRTRFLDFAMRLVMADKKLSPGENQFIDELFNAWEANYA